MGWSISAMKKLANEFKQWEFLTNSYKHGIYQILNKINRKCYIGSSAGHGFRNRWVTHYRQLENNKHHSISLQRAWNKYGKENFEFKILLYCDSKSCIFYEQIFLDFFHPEYNVSPTAGSQFGYHHSDETREKLKIAWLTRPPISEETKKRLSENGKKLNSVARMLTPQARNKAKESRRASFKCRGIYMGHSKTNEQEVLEIRALYRKGMNFNRISKIYTRLDRRTIRDICLYHSWKHVP